MNTQGHPLFNTREFRIAVVAALAVALLIGAAYWFGTGLRADTSASVAPSPLGSSLTAVRESRLDDYYGRFSNAVAAARLTALAGSRLDDYYGRLSNATAAFASASLAESRLEDSYFRTDRSSASARAVVPAENRSEDYFFRMYK